MYRKGKAKRIASITLAAVLLTATLFEGKVNVVAAESREQVSSTTGEAIVMTEAKSISAGDVSGGDISDGDTEKEDEKNISGESVTSGISRGCAWTLDAEGNLVVRDSDGTYGTDNWGWKDYKDKIKTADVNISYADLRGMLEDCISLTSAKVKIDDAVGHGTEGFFSGCVSLSDIDISGLNTQNATNMDHMFYRCGKLKYADIENFNTQNVTDMSYMFFRCESLKSIDIGELNTQNVTNMSGMFGYCYNLFNIDVSGFCTQNTTNMSNMFRACHSLAKIDVSGFNTQNVTDMSQMFEECFNLTEINVSNFDTANVTDMNSMFRYCERLISLDLTKFDTHNVIYMHKMFSQCENLINIDVSNFNTKNVINMHEMFSECRSLTNIDVSGFNTSKVTSMNGMFSGCSNLTSIDISGFDTGQPWTMDMNSMFTGCTNIQSIKVFPNLSSEIDLPISPMYDEKGNSYTQFPQKLPQGIWLYTEKIQTLDKNSVQVTDNVASIIFSDKTNKQIIKNVNVTDGTSTYSGTDLIQIPMSQTTDKKTLTITADGYYTVEKRVTLKKGEVTYISLTPKKSDTNLVIVDVMGVYNDEIYDLISQNFNMAYAPNIATKDNLTYGSIDITVKAESNILKYELIQDDKILQSSTNGQFSIKVITQEGSTNYTSPVTDELINGKKLYVRVTDNKGNQIQEVLSINISKSYTSQKTQTQKANLKVGKSLKISVPENIPLLGGGMLNIGLQEKDMPVELSIDEDGKVRFALNKKAISSMDEFEKDYKDLVKRAKNLSQASQTFGGTPQTFGGGFFNVGGKVCGYGEGNISEITEGNITLKVGIYAEIEGRGGYKQYFCRICSFKYIC